MANGFALTFTGDQENPPVATTASGAGSVSWDAAARTAAYKYMVSGVDFGPVLGLEPQTETTADDVTIMHVHNAPRGANGPVVFGQIGPAQDADDLSIVLNADGSWTVSGVWEPTDPANVSITQFAETLDLAVAGSEVPLYSNIHTTTFPGGEIRAQWVASATGEQAGDGLDLGGTIFPHHGIPIRFDPAGDFLSAYTGPPNGDLDVVLVGAFLTGPDEVVLSGTHAGLIGATPGAAYVWGIDRGAGAELLTELDPPAGEGVAFDAVVVVLPDGTGSFIDLAGGGAPQALDPSSVSISGPTISVTLPRSLLPSQGGDFADYAYNLWPRFAPDGVDPGDNTQISDFAPDASTFVARPPGSPEPEGVDWDALGGQAQANFEATGTWCL